MNKTTNPDGKIHRHPEGGYYIQCATLLDDKPAVATFGLAAAPDGCGTDGPRWSAWAVVEAQPGGPRRETLSAWRHWTKRELTECLRLLAAAGFVSQGKFAKCVLNSQQQRDYSVALVNGSNGEFEVVEKFLALDDEEANAYAERAYEGQDWYVLDSTGRNINGGE